MIKLKYYDIETVTVCPYCEDIASDSNGCCGESSSHFEKRYQTSDGELYNPEEVEVINPIMDRLRYGFLPYFGEHGSYLRRALIRTKMGKVRRKLGDLYDGHDSLILKLRIVSGFQWSRLDCFILKQLHDFPLYYTPPDEVIKMRQAALAEQIKMSV